MNQIVNVIFAAIITTFLMGCSQKNEGAPNSNTAGNPSAATSEQPSKVDSQSLYEQGRNFYGGINGVVDKAKAYELFSKSAEMGNAGAMFFLGVMNERGESVPVDLEKALEWYEKSNKLGCGCAPDSLIKDTKAKIAKAAAKKK